MEKYYVNKHHDLVGCHLVHKEGCSNPTPSHARFIMGYFENWTKALAKAHLLYNNVRGCEDCFPNYSSEVQFQQQPIQQ